jgi:hypothetical protein
MANYFTLILDLTGPSNPSISLESGSQYATSELITASISTSDSVTTNYQMKIWGDLDLAWAQANGITKGTATTTTQETDALPITYSTSKQLQLSATGGSKNIYIRIFDDVLNQSSQASASIILDTALPTVSITGPDKNKISKQSGKNVASFTFQVSEEFVEYKVKVVSASGAGESTGTIIPITTDTQLVAVDEQSSISTKAGATEMRDVKADSTTFPANTPITVKINGYDLDLASPGDGEKIIKVFVKDTSSQWSAS